MQELEEKREGGRQKGAAGANVQAESNQSRRFIYIAQNMSQTAATGLAT